MKRLELVTAISKSDSNLYPTLSWSPEPQPIQNLHDNRLNGKRTLNFDEDSGAF
jgi:hypothetical protein